MIGDKEEVEARLREFGSLPRFSDGRINYTDSKRALVLTIFLFYNGKVLLLKRSEKVLTYKNLWSCVGGYVDEPVDIKFKVLEELREELGVFESDVGSIKVIDPIEFIDKDMIWINYTVRVDLDREVEIKLDWEHTDYVWIDPEEIGNYDIVFNVDKNLRRVLS